MNSAFDNSRAVIAQQKNPYFFKSGGLSYATEHHFQCRLCVCPPPVCVTGDFVSFQFHNTDLARHARIIQYYSQETTINMGYLFGDDVVGSPTMAPIMALRSLT